MGSSPGMLPPSPYGCVGWKDCGSDRPSSTARYRYRSYQFDRASCKLPHDRDRETDRATGGSRSAPNPLMPPCARSIAAPRPAVHDMQSGHQPHFLDAAPGTGSRCLGLGEDAQPSKTAFLGSGPQAPRRRLSSISQSRQAPGRCGGAAALPWRQPRALGGASPPAEAAGLFPRRFLVLRCRCANAKMPCVFPILCFSYSYCLAAKLRAHLASTAMMRSSIS